MRYEDASATGSFMADQAATPSTLNANGDVDVILAGNYGPATGNAITGTGTISGIAGADMVASGASITAIQGAGGTDTSFSAGKLQVAGEHGVLTIDAQGNYSYVRNQGSPNGVSDVFTYTLAGRDGDTDLATLTINIGKTPLAVQANAVQVVPGPDGVVTLPPGVELSDIHVVGRNLVVELPDGSQMIIVDGAVFVPQLVLGTVEVPSTNLAALLIDSEPTPAAGPPQSSGGNFAVPVDPLDPGEPLGDLIPPTELSFTPPTFEELAQAVEEDEPVLITDLTPSLSGGDAIVDEDDLLASRGAGESAGSDPTKESLTVSGTFTLIAPDGVESLTVGTLNVIVNGNFQAGATLTTPLGNTLTMTGYNAATGVVSYTYTLADNEAHANGAGENSLFEDFLVTLTDEDGDVDTDTLSVNIVDDVPTAVNDTVGQTTESQPVTFGVFGNDTFGADGVDTDNNPVVAVTFTQPPAGQGTVSYNAATGLFTFTPAAGQEGSTSFTYTITDGDGDPSTATVTVNLQPDSVPIVTAAVAAVDDDGLAGGNAASNVDDLDANAGEVPLSASEATYSGTFVANFGGDAPGTFSLAAMNGTSGSVGTETVNYTYAGNVLTATGPRGVLFTVTVTPATGAFVVQLVDNVLHAAGNNENDATAALTFTATDSEGDSTPGTLTITFDDDGPSVAPTLNEVSAAIVDESAPVDANTIPLVGGFTAGDDPHLSGAIAIGKGSTSGPVIDANAVFGADGPAASGSEVYELVVLNSVSGLTTTEGQAINLVKLDNGVVVGVVNGTTTAAFAIQIDATSGVVTVEQYLSLNHPDFPNNYDEAIFLNGGSLGVTVTAEDFDGDTATSDPVDIAPLISFNDDGPNAVDDGSLGSFDDNVAGVNIGTVAGLLANDNYGADGPAASGAITIATGSLGGTITIDGSGNLIYTSNHNVVPGGNEVETFTYTIKDGDLDTDTATFTVTLTDTGPTIDAVPASISVDEEGLTNGIAGTIYGDGSDLAGQNFSQSGTLSGLSFGGDGPGDIVLAAVADTGLRTLANQVVASSWDLATHTLTGFVDLDANGFDAGDISVFTLQITDVATGTYTYTQLLPVKHADANTEDNALFSVAVTVTDSEGDPAVGSIDILIDDDSPDAVDDGSRGTFDDGATNVNIGNVLGLLVNDGFGADGPAAANSITFAVGSLGGTISLDGSGNMLYTSNHDTTPGNTDVETFTYTITDADGDTDTATFTVSLTDGGPAIGTTGVVIDEEGLAGGIAGTVYGDGSDLPGTAITQSGTLIGIDFGDDGVGDIVLAAVADTGLRTLANQVVASSWDLATHTLTGFVDLDANGFDAGDISVFTLQITDVATGTYTYTQLLPVKHADANTEDNALFSVAVTVTDSEGDPAIGSINVLIDDDSPDVAAALNADAAVELDETLPSTASTITLVNGIAKGNDPDLSDATGIAIGRAVSAESVLTLTTEAYGADGPAANPDDAVYTLAINNALSGLTTTEGQAINLVSQQNGTVIVGVVQGGVFAGQAAFAIQIDPETGVITVEQYLSLDHPNMSDPNDALNMTAGHVSAIVTIEDGDGDTDTSTPVDISGLITFRDDGPTVTVNAEVQPDLTVDESDFTINAGPTSFAGLFDVDFGADGPATTGALDFELNIDTGDTGLVDTLTGEDVILVKVGETIEGRTDTTNALVFVISVNADGEVSLDQQRSIIHPNPADPNESITFAADSLITLSLTATDGDGDSHTVGDPIDIAQNFLFFDDGPTIDAANVTDPLEIENTGTPTGTGDFPFDVGADVNGDFDDISVDNFTIMINGVPATNVVLTEDVDALGDPSPETATTASYRFTFQYDVGASELANASGTLVFNKATGQYTVTLDSGPILGFSFLETGSDTTDFVEFDLNGGAPDVVTAQLATDLFAQFTAESTNNNSIPNLLTTGGNDIAWNPGELFTADPGNPQVSSTDAGVDGNTMDTGEVLDFNLYTTDPGSDTTGTPDGFAAEMFIEFFQATASDDIIVILKLANADDPSITTTRAIIIDGEDAFVQGDTATGTLYEGMVAALGSQEALVVIQHNDFNADGENWVIVGAQIVTDNDGTSGTGVDLNGDLGLAGASDRDGDGDFTTDSGNAALDELDTFAEDTDTSGIKITSIGFLVPSTTAQQAIIEFDVTITDGDDDTVTYEDVTVTIGDAPAPPVVLDMDGDGVEFVDQSAGVAYDYNGDGVAEATGWAGVDDAILVRDADGNGTVDNASEFVFGGNGVTDLEALNAEYGDTLDASDADFASFAVWQDANSNGVADAGEVVSLTDAGIASISLVSDGVAYSANDDVEVAGTGSYTNADGSTGQLADAIFLTEQRNAANTNTAMIAALAAAGVVAEQAAAQPADLASTSTVAIAASLVASNSSAVDSQEEVSGSALGGEASEAGAEESSEVSSSSSSSGDQAADGNSLTADNDLSADSQPAQLLEGTEAPANVTVESIVSPVVSMPSAEALIAASLEGGATEGGQSNAVVGQVLIDALEGGGAEASVDALLAALPDQGLGENAAVEALASQPDATVSAWDMSYSGGLSANANFTMEAMALHHDAVQPVANG